MKVIYENGRKVGSDPIGFYVYLWTHNGEVRYVGKGVNGRWAAHLTPNRLEFPVKRRYFSQHLPEMTCSILQDGLSEDDAGRLEIERIAQHGFMADGTGTLVNARGGSIAPRERVRREKAWAHKAFYIRLWRRLLEEGDFAPNAMIQRIIAHNPKRTTRMGASFSHENFELYPAVGESVTVAEHNAKALSEGFKAGEQRGHLAYDVVNGFIGAALPKGEMVAPGFIVPTKDVLYRLALEVGTEDEWQKHCTFRARQGGKVGG